MLFLVIPRGDLTDYLIEKARQFGGGKVNVKVLEAESDALDPELVSIFVLKGYREEAEVLNRLRASKGLPEAFIVEVPKPVVKRRIIRNPVRVRIAQILSKGPMHGYAIYKKYRELFGKVSMRLIYYHLERGLREGIFEVVDVDEVEGDFSWGRRAMRKYYRLVE